MRPIVGGSRRRCGTAASIAPFFTDDFTGGQKNNANGVTWLTPSGDVSVVTFDGAQALRYRYAATADGVACPNTEQRMNLGRNLAHFCAEYQLHVPSNFAHRATGEGGSFANNKFFMMWREPYSDTARGTWRVGFEYPRTSDTASYVRAMSSRWNLNSWTSSNSTGDYLPTGQSSALISSSGPVVIGSWNTIRVEAKAASNSSAADGIQRLWVNGVKIVEITTGKFWNFDTGLTPTDCFLDRCYFLGYANSGFAAQTDFHLRGVKLYDTNPGWL